MTTIIDVFNDYFEMVPAVSSELKEEVYKLRYQVYCIETGFENPGQYPDGMEFDEYDSHSIHYLIRHRRSGDYAATTRLILPDALRPEKSFPLELHCKVDNFAVMEVVDRKHLGEASRLCVSKAFKKRKNESNTLINADCTNQDYFTPHERRIFPHISFSLIACLIRACRENDIHYFFGTLEPAWFRFLSSSGIHFTKIGPLIDYRGARWPGVIKVSDLLDGVAAKNSELWDMLTNKGHYWKV